MWERKKEPVQISQGSQDVHQLFLDLAIQMLKSLSLYHWKFFSKECEMISRNIRLYSIFTFDPLHNFHLEILKPTKECTIKYLLLDRLRTNPDKFESQRRTLCSMWNTIMQACTSLLTAIQKDYYAPALHVGFSEKGTEFQVNGLFFAGRLRGMLEGKNWKNVDMVSPFVPWFIFRCPVQ